MLSSAGPDGDLRGHRAKQGFFQLPRCVLVVETVRAVLVMVDSSGSFDSGLRPPLRMTSLLDPVVASLSLGWVNCELRVANVAGYG